MKPIPATIQIAPVTNMQLYPMLPTYGIAYAIPEIHAPGIAATRYEPLLMRSFYIIFVVMYFTFFCIGQTNTEFSIYLNKRNNIKGKIDTITENQYLKHFSTINRCYCKKNSVAEQVLKNLLSKYSDAMFDSSSCLILKGNNKHKSLCNDTSSEDSKGWTSYTLCDYQNQYLIFISTGYEEYEYVLFNPKTKILKTIGEYPIFLDNKIFAGGNYYGTGGFEYESLDNEYYFGFDISKWELENYYYYNNDFYFHFVSFDEYKFDKYLKLILSNGS